MQRLLKDVKHVPLVPDAYRVLCLSKILIEFAFVQEDVELYKSSPPLLGTDRPSHPLPRAFVRSTYSKKSLVLWKVAWIVLISNFFCADDGAAGDDSGGERSPSPSAGGWADHPKGARSVA